MREASGSVKKRYENGGLFRRLLVPLLVLVIAAGGVGALWNGRSRALEFRERTLVTMRGNAELIVRLKLPLSERLMENFSTAMGRPLGVVGPQQQSAFSKDWTAGERDWALNAAREGEGWDRREETELLMMPIAGTNQYLVALNRGVSWFSWRDASSWWVFGVVGMLGVVFAFVLARRLVVPLRELAQRAPTMDYSVMPDALIKRRDELGTLARALRDARSRMIRERDRRKQSERLAMLGQIATGLAHEIRNPAAAILAQAEVLKASGTSEAELILDEAEEVLALVNQWMFIARPEPPQMRPMSLVRCVRELCGQMAAQAKFHQVEFHLDLVESLNICGDVRRIQQVLRNLINNGIAAMPGGGRLSICGREKDGDVVLTVDDQGQGFSESALRHFGEPFYSEKEGGMGLGLALVKGVVEAHGGKVRVENPTGGGARVEIVLKSESK